MDQIICIWWPFFDRFNDLYPNRFFWNAVYRESSCRARYLGHAVVTSKKLQETSNESF